MSEICLIEPMRLFGNLLNIIPEVTVIPTNNGERYINKQNQSRKYQLGFILRYHWSLALNRLQNQWQ